MVRSDDDYRFHGYNFLRRDSELGLALEVHEAHETVGQMYYLHFQKKFYSFQQNQRGLITHKKLKSPHRKLSFSPESTLTNNLLNNNVF